MSVRRFTSESYPDGERRSAWQEVLGTLGLVTTSATSVPNAHAVAVLRGAADTLVLARLAAGPQSLSATARPAGPPVLVMPLEACVLESVGGRRSVSAGEGVLLPRPGDDRLHFEGDLRAIVLMPSLEAFRSRKLGSIDLGGARLVRPQGLAAILMQSAAAAAEGIEALSEAEWSAVDAALAELLLTLLRQVSAPGVATGATAVQAAMLNRIRQAIERHLDDPDFSPARAAQAEGISERYLHKLFEGTSDSFAQTLRDSRLLRSRQDLANPAEAHQSVAEIGYRCGFTDAAHFSRVFRERFGLSPRAFRQAEAERLKASPTPGAQRGWPQAVAASARLRRTEAKGEGGGPGPAEERIGVAPRHHHLSVSVASVHWGYFSRALAPVLEIASGDTVTIETLSQHASDDPALMIAGDPGAESVFAWTATHKAVDRRGAGPMEATIYGRGAGEGFGVHICTGPIAVRGAEPGDVLEIRILDIVPRPSRGPGVEGRVFGSSVAAWWGYHYGELLTEPKPREIVTIYEIEPNGPDPHARALYAYRWAPQTDPFGTVHATYDYPGVPVAPGTVSRRHGVLQDVRIPLRPHFGVIGVAPREADLVDSVPPSYFGGNLDNWRLGKGSAVYLPVSVPGALLSLGDPHAAQGDGELSGTAIECSMTGTLAVVLHKRRDLAGRPFADLTYPLIETPTDWVLTGFSHPNYLAEFGAKGQSAVYATSSIDLAMKDAFRKARRFLMQAGGLDEDEAIALISAAVDFGVTQVVDGNWGVHATVSKRLLSGTPLARTSQ